MKGIALWQPWASLVAYGLKTFETRGWAAPGWLVGQRIAIHATKGVEPGGEAAFRETCERPRFRWALRQIGTTAEGLPRGAIVATAVLSRCVEMTDELIYEVEERNPVEVDFGLWEPGRFAWALEDVVRLEEPVEFSGSQGLMDVPRELVWQSLEQGRLEAL